MRPQALLKLLQSVQRQILYPTEILIIDGSTNNETKDILVEHQFKNLKYYSVPNECRGLTKQRNYGIDRVENEIEIVCFLDDDVVLEVSYFNSLLKTYHIFPEALGVGGYIIDENGCEFVGDNYKPKINEYFFDGWLRKDSSRFILRKRLGLDSNRPPGFSPLFSHGRSVSFLPPSNKTYEVEMLMGGVSSFRKKIFNIHKFSDYFEGYGLYEDADFSIRIAKTGKLYLNTAAKLYHYHAELGRPNQYNYGKMVVKNGWYIWRTKNPKPNINSIIKWHAITALLIIIRFSNIFTTLKRQKAFTETTGRVVGWFHVLIHK